MRPLTYVVAIAALAGWASACAQSTGGTGGAQNTANPNATPGAQAPVNQPQTSAPPSTPTPATRSVPTPSSQSTQTTPAQPTQPNAAPQTQPVQPNATTQQTMPAQRNSTPQQTVLPPDSQNTTRNNPTTNNSVNNQQRVPPAARGVGTTANRPDCSRLRGLEKSECERRDTSRDDLPAGVTTTQPEKPQQ